MVLSVVIVTRNSRRYIERCLECVAHASQGIEYEVVVVDNASSDDTVEVIRQRFPGVRLLTCEDNRGFGAANNLGARCTTGEFILFLNPDTEIERDSLRNAVEYLRNNPQVGLLGGRVFTGDGKLQVPCTTSFRTLWAEICVQFYLYRLFPKSRVFASYTRTFARHNHIERVDVIAGCFMFMRRRAFEEIGGFDENIFLYCEEEDICYRLRCRDWQVVFHPNVRLLHHGGKSNNGFSLNPWTIRSRDYVARRQNSRFTYTVIRVLRIVGASLRVLFVLLIRPNDTRLLKQHMYNLKFNLLLGREVRRGLEIPKHGCNPE